MIAANTVKWLDELNQSLCSEWMVADPEITTVSRVSRGEFD
jgi:hypothetical protein